MKFSLSNFAQQNTPANIQKLGNCLLIIAAIGLGIQTFPSENPDLNIILPAILVKASNWMISIGVIGKMITKLFGESRPK